MSSWRPSKIISGGQTGADLGALVAAERCGIATGGTAPQGYRTEKGAQIEVLRDRFGLIEHPSKDYKPRTRENIANADATLILSTNFASSGTQLTIAFCEDLDKQYYLADPSHPNTLRHIRLFLEKSKPSVLNVAGNRESVSPGLTRTVAALLQAVFNNAPNGKITIHNSERGANR